MNTQQMIAGFMFVLLLGLSIAEYWSPEVKALVG